MPIDQLIKLMGIVGDVCNVVYNIAHHAGLLAALPLIKDVQALGSFSAIELLSEVKVLSQDNRKLVEDAFKASLKLDGGVIEAKVESGVDVLEDGIKKAYEAIALEQSVVKYVQDVKTYFNS